MKLSRKTDQSGFTLIELLIATTVFSVILLVAAATVIQLGRMYYKGVITSKTQNIARSVTDDVSRTIQFSNGSIGYVSVGSDPRIQAYCFGNTRYSFVLRGQVDSNAPDGSFDLNTGKIRHVLWQDRINNEPCGTDLPQLQNANPQTGPTDREGRELLENNMRLQDFNITSHNGASDAYKVGVKIVYYADPDLLNDFNNPTACKGSVVGGQWCAISDLSSVVYSRAK